LLAEETEKKGGGKLSLAQVLTIELLEGKDPSGGRGVGGEEINFYKRGEERGAWGEKK